MLFRSQVVRLAMDNPAAEAELRSVLRAAQSAAAADLPEVVIRARRLATLHDAWSGWLAAAIADRKRQRWTAARAALDLALELASGATAVHQEMVGVLLALGNVPGAVDHAERAIALDGENPASLAALARAMSAADRVHEARQAAGRALALQPQAEDLKALVEELNRTAVAGGGWRARLRAMWRSGR